MWFTGFPWYSAATSPSTNTHTHHTARLDLAKRWLRHCHYIHHIQLVAACPATTTGASGPILKVTDTLVLTSGPPDANDLDSAPQACNFWSLIRPDGSAPATLASLDARSCGHCILYALTGPRPYTAIPVFAPKYRTCDQYFSLIFFRGLSNALSEVFLETFLFETCLALSWVWTSNTFAPCSFEICFSMPHALGRCG